MNKGTFYTFSSPLKRSTVYTVTFALGASAFEVFRLLVHTRSLVPETVLMGAFIAIGGFLVCERNIVSRIASASTLFALSFIAIAFSDDVLDPFYLLLVLIIAAIGAQPFLHKKPGSLTKTVAYSTGIVVAAVAFAIVFIYGTTILQNILFTPYLTRP